MDFCQHQLIEEEGEEVCCLCGLVIGPVFVYPSGETSFFQLKKNSNFLYDIASNHNISYGIIENAINNAEKYKLILNSMHVKYKLKELYMYSLISILNNSGTTLDLNKICNSNLINKSNFKIFEKILKLEREIDQPSNYVEILCYILHLKDSREIATKILKEMKHLKPDFVSWKPKNVAGAYIYIYLKKYNIANFSMKNFCRITKTSLSSVSRICKELNI